MPQDPRTLSQYVCWWYVVHDNLSQITHLCLLALYLFESLISLPLEIDVVWCQKWSAITWVYAFTRYSTVLSCIVSFIPTGGTAEVCQARTLVLSVLEIEAGELFYFAGVSCPLIARYY